ncbi:MAG TPA: class I SAM-dependent methyltransferase [Candidatus Limnocylindrales bacterium]|nr:class I SAM-dependent methyltransferase [Candidatus Limnocylindrales bacterium]
MNLNSLELFKKIFFKNALMFKKTFLEVQSEFGPSWELEFDIHLEKLFGNDEEAYKNAVRGYTKFAIDAMRLQQLFNKKLKYEEVTYQEAYQKVYMNEDYMMHLYLPGIFISHFLWRHHHRQFLYYKKNFLPLLDTQDDKRFYEVGTGTGFYTVQIFRYDRNFHGYGIDISPYSRQFTMNNIKGWGYANSFTPMDINIIGADLEPLPCIQVVEVLEHLSDPQLFLNHLRKLLKPEGYGFITAALTAPNADHIYLYWTPDDVIKQLVSAGFKVLDYIEERAYEGQPGEIVPKVAAFIVS